MCQIKRTTLNCYELFDRSVLSERKRIWDRMKQPQLALRVHSHDGCTPRREVPLRATLKSNVRRVADVMDRSCENSSSEQTREQRRVLHHGEKKSRVTLNPQVFICCACAEI